MAHVSVTQVPPAVLSLKSSLRTLDLSVNRLTSLPPSVGDFSLLKTLNVSHNRLSERDSLSSPSLSLFSLPLFILISIPFSSLSYTLQTLSSFSIKKAPISLQPRQVHHSFYENHHFFVDTCLHITSPFSSSLASLPDLGQLKKLETLTADDNSLSSLPDSFSQLKSLKSLHLSHNKLSTFPPHLRQLSHLQFVDLSANQIAEIPAENVEGLALVELNLNNNSVSVIPEALATCQRLKVKVVYIQWNL